MGEQKAPGVDGNRADHLIGEVVEDRSFARGAGRRRADWKEIAVQSGTWLRPAATVAVAGFLVYQLTAAGWNDVFEALPTTPGFYVLVLAAFMVQPVAELLIYRGLWPIRILHGLKVFFAKRVYNDELFGYSGEAVLFGWARKHTALDDRVLLRNVRDVNILSAFSAMAIAAGLLTLLVVSGVAEMPEITLPVEGGRIIIAALLGVLVAVVIIRFRRHMFALSAGDAARILGIHTARFSLFHILVVLQWFAAMPHVTLGVWLTLIATVIVVNRIPFVPSKDLLFVGAGVELSRHLSVATAELAAMLLVAAVLTKTMNLVAFVLTRDLRPLKQPLSAVPA
jgi:hypothetical protein